MENISLRPQADRIPDHADFRPKAARLMDQAREVLRYLFIVGAPERIRTSDLCLRRAALYPAELRAHRFFSSVLILSPPRGLIRAFLALSLQALLMQRPNLFPTN